MNIPEMYKPILARLDADQARFRDLEAEMNLPETAARPARLIELAKEHGKLGRQLGKSRQFQAAKKALEETADLAQGSDPDMKALAEAELPALQSQRDAT